MKLNSPSSTLRPTLTMLGDLFKTTALDETSTEAFTYPIETFSSEYGFSDHSTQDSFLAHVPLSTDTPTPAKKESDDSEKQPASTSLSDVAMPPPAELARQNVANAIRETAPPYCRVVRLIGGNRRQAA